MDVCSSGHEEIVYLGRYCPMCELIDEHKDEVDLLNKRIDELEAKEVV